MVFRGDGSYRSYTGGEGRWRLAGTRLTMSGANGSFVLIVARLGRDRRRIANADGSAGISQRCRALPPKRAAAATGALRAVRDSLLSC